MKRTDFLGLASFLLVSLSPSIVHAKPFDSRPLIGNWKKEFIVQNGSKNSDSRWELTIQFQKDGLFSYFSKNIMELQKSNGQSETLTEITDLVGKWTVNGKGDVHIKFDRKPKEGELTEVITNLDYDPRLNRATIKCEIENELLLTVTATGSKRKLFFKKAATH